MASKCSLKACDELHQAMYALFFLYFNATNAFTAKLNNSGSFSALTHYSLGEYYYAF